MWAYIMLNDDAWFELNVNYRGKCNAKKIHFFWSVIRDCICMSLKLKILFIPSQAWIKNTWDVLKTSSFFTDLGMGTKMRMEKYDESSKRIKKPAASDFFSCIRNKGLMLWLSQPLFFRSSFRVQLTYAKTSSSLISIRYNVESKVNMYHIRYTR